jgi:dolichol-phosphate mannosyltransferase
MSAVHPLLSVVSPVYCEELGIDEFHRRLAAVLDGLAGTCAAEIVYVNDGSTDSSLARLRAIAATDPRVRVLDLSRNFGHQLAITAGIERARGDAVIVIDSDLQDPPEVIPAMVARWQEGNKVVYGIRTRRAGESRFKLLTARIHYRLLDRFADVRMPHDAGDFRLMDRAVVDVLKQMQEENRYMRGMVAWVGFQQCGVEYEREARYAGTTAYTFRKMLRLAVDAVTGFSDRPLRMMTGLGLIATAVGLASGVYVIVAELVGNSDTLRGWASLMTAVLFMGGIQLLCVGIIGEYIGRIYRETKRRPLYVVAEEIGRTTTADRTAGPDEDASEPGTTNRG